MSVRRTGDRTAILPSPTLMMHTVVSSFRSRRVLGGGATIVLLFLSALAFQRGQHSSLLVLILVIAVGTIAAITAAVLWTYYRWSEVFLTSETIGMRTWGLAQRAFPRSVASRIEQCTLAAASGQNYRMIYVLDQMGRRLFEIPADYWDPKELASLWNELDIAPSGSWSVIFPYAQRATLFPVRPS
jgi:hypothetical protein